MLSKRDLKYLINKHIRLDIDFNEGKYGSTKKLGRLPVRYLLGRVVFLKSLGSLGLCTKASSWTNPPIAPPFRKSLYKVLRLALLKTNRIGTLQGELSYWKGQKREPWECVDESIFYKS